MLARRSDLWTASCRSGDSRRDLNLILLEEGDLAPDGTWRLTGRRARHVREVHRAAVGEELVVGRLGGRIGKGTVLASSEGEVVLQVALDSDPPPPVPVDLLLAMPRPKILRRVLQAASSLGVKRLVLVNSYRVEKSYFATPLLAPEELLEHLKLGLEQGRDTVVPEVRVEKRFRPFVEDSLDALWPSTRRLIAHPVAARALERGRADERVVLAIGPEGGWIDYEVRMLEERGFLRFSLGPRILRVDVAVPFAVAQVQLLTRA
jgi:16S rRNA (uracil1498-N3)-methyltransferase